MHFFPILTHISNTNKIVNTEMNDCPVCLERTCNTLDRTCSHPLCLPCIGQLKDYSRILSDTGIRTFNCPLCRVESRPSYEDLEERCRVLSANPPRQFNPPPVPMTIWRWNALQRRINVPSPVTPQRRNNIPSPVTPQRRIRPPRMQCQGSCDRRTTRRCPALNPRCENNVCRQCNTCRDCVNYSRSGRRQG